MILSGRIPSRIHQTASRERPPGASVEKGGPLSVRIASGKPNSEKAASNPGRTAANTLLCRPSHRRRNRLNPSVIVSGLHLAPSTWKWPLKSAHQTAFGAAYSRSRSAYGDDRARRFGSPTRPWRFRMEPTVLAAGSRRPGSFRRTITRSFRGPHLGWRRRAATSALTTSGATA